MIFAIVLLVVSFVAMLSMIVVGQYEMKAGRRLFVLPARSWTDKKVHASLHETRAIIQVAATKNFWTGLTSYAGRKFVEKVWHHPHVKKATKKAADVVRGKKEIKPTGTVSYYLKDVSEYKKDMPQ